MKKLLVAFFLVFALAPATTKGQVLISILFGEQLNSGKMEFGLVGGLNLSQLPGLEDPKFKRSFGLGLFLDYKFTDSWILATEVNMKTTLGSNNLELADFPYPVNDTIVSESDKAYRNLNLINVPILINYRLGNRLGFGAGFYASLVHGTRDYVQYTQGNWTSTFERSFTDQINRLDFGVSGMVHFHFLGNPGIQLRGRINYGLTEVFKETSGLSSNNLWYSITVAVPIVIKL